MGDLKAAWEDANRLQQKRANHVELFTAIDELKRWASVPITWERVNLGVPRLIAAAFVLAGIVTAVAIAAFWIAAGLIALKIPLAVDLMGRDVAMIYREGSDILLSYVGPILLWPAFVVFPVAISVGSLWLGGTMYRISIEDAERLAAAKARV